jgi:hypothetical protein
MQGAAFDERHPSFICQRSLLKSLTRRRGTARSGRSSCAHRSRSQPAAPVARRSRHRCSAGAVAAEGAVGARRTRRHPRPRDAQPTRRHLPQQHLHHHHPHWRPLSVTSAPAVWCRSAAAPEPHNATHTVRLHRETHTVNTQRTAAAATYHVCRKLLRVKQVDDCPP